MINFWKVSISSLCLLHKATTALHPASIFGGKLSFRYIEGDMETIFFSPLPTHEEKILRYF